MFRKIVSNLSFSPALVGQLGFYARRLKKEETTRRLGLVFTALALVVQSFAVFTPPEAANAASSADFVSGGVSTIGEYLRRYDNDGWIRGVYTSLGITRANISNAKLQTICEDGKYNWSRTSLYSTAQGQRSWGFKTASGNNATAYYRPMELTQGGPCHQAFVGHSDVFGWFAVKKDCGNLITKVPPHSPNPKAVCQSLNVKAITMKRFRVTAKSSTEDGASIKKYKYEIKRGGEIVAKRGFDSSRTTHEWVYEQATPGTYHAQVYVVTSEGEKTNRDCKDAFVVDEKPVAICTDLAVNVTNRTIVSLRGKAKAENGAKIKRYVFVVSKDGKEVKRVVVKTSKEQAAAESFALKQAGDYRVRLTVVTSIGDRTGPECVKPLTIAKKEVCAYNPSLPANSPECQPCPDNPEIWIKDEDCDAELINTKSVTNMTQGNVDATTKVARASDKLTYTITVQNRGFASESVVFSENLEDVLEYATLVDRGGASFNEDSKTLTWPAVRLAAGETQSRTLAVQIMSDIPSTNTGTSNEDSYDCRMVNTFGNSVDVDVECATQKVVVEQVVSELPETGPRENMMFAAALLAVVTYFYARSRQLGKEVRLIRRNLNTGTV
jgi:hypothetical protein